MKQQATRLPHSPPPPSPAISSSSSPWHLSCLRLYPNNLLPGRTHGARTNCKAIAARVAQMNTNMSVCVNNGCAWKHSQLCDWMHLWGGGRERDSHSKSCVRVYVCNLKSQKLSRLLKSLARLTHTQANTLASHIACIVRRVPEELFFFSFGYVLSSVVTFNSLVCKHTASFFGQQNILGLSQKWSYVRQGKATQLNFWHNFFSLDFKLLPAWLPGCLSASLSVSLYAAALRELPKLN